MKNYEKPIAIANDELMQGVYAASGCYYPKAYIHQRPETGRGDYRIQVSARHNATHTCSMQVLTLVFNQPVVYVSSNGVAMGAGSGTSIKIKYEYWNNEQDNIGLGDVIVTSEPGLSIVSVSLVD